MATDVAEKPAPETAAPPAPKPPLLNGKKLKIALLLLLVMGVQVAIGYVLIPAEATPDPNRNPAAEAEDAQLDAADIDTMEVEIGKFSATNGVGNTGDTVDVRFSVVAIVSRSQGQAFMQAATQDHEFRVREAIEKVARSSSLDDLHDPSLEVIKRKIREEVNKVLRKSYVIQVVINDLRVQTL